MKYVFAAAIIGILSFIAVLLHMYRNAAKIDQSDVKIEELETVTCDEQAWPRVNQGCIRGTDDGDVRIIRKGWRE